MARLRVTTSPACHDRRSVMARPSAERSPVAAPEASRSVAWRHQHGTRSESVHGSDGLARTLTRTSPSHGYEVSTASRASPAAISAEAYWWTWIPLSVAVARSCAHEPTNRIRFGGQQAQAYQAARSPDPGSA